MIWGIFMNVMFYAYNEQTYQKMIRHLNSGEFIVLVSTNASLLNSYKRENKSIMLDSESPFYSKETFEIIDYINQVIKNLNIHKNYLYEVEDRLEGGLGGNVQEFLYLVDIFDKIIKKNDIRKIYCERIAGKLENLALSCLSEKYGIYVYYYDISCFKQRIYHSSFFLLSRPVDLYCNLKSIRNIRKITRKNKNDKKVDYFDVGYVLWSGAKKHIKWVQEQLEAYDDILKTGIFCYHAEEGKNQLLDKGKIVKSVEAYGDFKTIMKSYRDYKFNKRKIILSLNRNIEENRIYFRNIDVTKNIFYLFERFVNREKLADIVYDNMVNEFIKYNRFKLLTGSGDTNFISNKSFFFNASRQKMSFFSFTEHTHMAGIIYPTNCISREAYPSMLRFGFFYKQSTDLQQLLSQGWQGDYYFFPDPAFVKYYNRSNVENNYSFCTNEKSDMKVLWAPSNPVYGLYSVGNFMEDNKKIILEVNRMPCSLKIKYHPLQDEEQISIIRDFCKECNNVDWVSRNEAIEPYIDWADIVITTPSSVMLDAALQGRFVVCIVNDLSLQYLHHIRDFFYTVKSGKLDFENILYDINFRKMWINRQNVYLEENLQMSNEKTIVEIMRYYIDQLG